MDIVWQSVNPHKGRQAMSRRKIAKIGSYMVLFDSELQEYSVKLAHKPTEDGTYYTDDREDALDTAKARNGVALAKLPFSPLMSTSANFTIGREDFGHLEVHLVERPGHISATIATYGREDVTPTEDKRYEQTFGGFWVLTTPGMGFNHHGGISDGKLYTGRELASDDTTNLLNHLLSKSRKGGPNA